MIRKAKIEDLKELMDIFESAKMIMRESGNMTQWSDGYPQKELIEQDIIKGQLYVIKEDEIEACFVLQTGEDPTYAYIEGSWLSNSPYITIHRIAKRGGHDIFKKALSFAKEKIDHLRIDTHKDNVIMRHVLESNGFKYRGIIYLLDGDPRLAYEYLKDQDK